MQKNNRTALFETAPIPKAVATMAIPCVLTSLVSLLYNLADTYFVGALGDPVQNAAVTLAAPLILAFNAVNNLFGVGSSSMMSRALGRKDFDTVRKSAAFGFYCSLFAGLLFSIVFTVFKNPCMRMLGATEETIQKTSEYLFWTVTLGAAPAILNVVMAYMVRAEGAALHASIGTMSGCILNIILDPFFIMPWGLNMGAAGAGCATFIANCVACLYFFILLIVRRKSTFVCIKPSAFKPNREIVLGVCGVGIPASIQNLLNVTGMTVLNNFAAGYGAVPLAAIGVAQKINQVPFFMAMGISQGIMPLVSYNYASGNIKRMKNVFWFASRISLSFLCVMMVCFFSFSHGLVNMFIQNEEVVAYGAKYLRLLCFAQPLLCMDFLAVGVFQACGMGRKALAFAIMRKVVLEIPFLLLFNALWPVYGIACAQPAAELILAAVAFITLMKLFKRLQLEADARAQLV